MSLETRIIMHSKDKAEGSKKHGVMSQPNQPEGPGGQMGVPMSGGQTNMGMNPMTSMSQMGVNVMGQQEMVHQMQQSQLVQQMQPGLNQGGKMMGGMAQQQSNQQSQQQHQISQQGQNQMVNQGQMTLSLNHSQIQIQQIQNARMGNPQMQQQLQMQKVQMQQALMQGNSQQIMMTSNQHQVMMQGNQPQQTMIGGAQPQMIMQGNAPQQQGMMQATSQGQHGVMTGNQQQQPGNPQQQQEQMMQVRGIPNVQMVGNRMMNPNSPNGSTTLTALARAQQQRKVQQQRLMISNAMGIPRPEHGPNYSMNRLHYGQNMTQVDNVPVNVQFSGVPGGTQMPQRPVRYFVPSNTSQGMPSPSPGGINVSGQMSQPQPPPQSTFVNSPGSQNIMHRPLGPDVNVNSLSPFPNSMVNVRSPNTNLNTPMPMSPTPSPRNAEEQACIQKIQELKKYTVLLERMIAKIGNEDMEKSRKMKKLLEILKNPNQRVSMEILLKCEVALKRMERSQLNPWGVLGPFQQIQDSIILSLKIGASSHTFLQTFGQSVEALTGTPFVTPSDPVEPEPELLYYPDLELTVDIPSVLRRELKIVDNRFRIKVIKNSRSSLSLVLHVSLTESRLPRVPPLKILIPPDYPDENPSVLDLQSEYGSTGFLNSVARTLKSRLLNLPQRFTVLELLSCWEMSVRQVCNPNYKETAASLKEVVK